MKPTRNYKPYLFYLVCFDVAWGLNNSGADVVDGSLLTLASAFVGVAIMAILSGPYVLRTIDGFMPSEKKDGVPHSEQGLSESRDRLTAHPDFTRVMFFSCLGLSAVLIAFTDTTLDTLLAVNTQNLFGFVYACLVVLVIWILGRTKKRRPGTP